MLLDRRRLNPLMPLVGLWLAVVLLVAAAPGEDDEGSNGLKMSPELKSAGVTEQELGGAYDPPVDVGHPDGNVTPALGGRAILHVASEAPNLNFLLENSAVVRQIHFDIHAGLLQFSPITWEYEPDVATSYDIEDTLVLKGGGGDDWENIAFGKVTETDDGYVLESGSSSHEMDIRTFAKDEVAEVLYGSVYTFHLRETTWHDGHPFDADDAFFSWDVLNNMSVDCDEKRSKYLKVARAEVLDDRTVRYFWSQQYFGSTGAFGLDLCLLPRHLYDLNDPDNADYNPEATDEEAGAYVNDNPHNIEWVGLGPYQFKTWERGQYLDATKWDGYWEKDPAKSGYLDTIRWRHVSDDDAAWLALLNDEIDIFNRVKTEDFVGAQTRTELFKEKAYKVLTYVGNLGYTSWNLYRPKLADVRVRKALAHAFDIKDWIRTNYEGLALWSTGSQFHFGPGYNHDVMGYEYDLDQAEDLLADAGWYDRDGNGIIDKDGEDFVLEMLMPSGNKASEKYLQAVQNSYRKIGIKLTITPYEWATFLEKILDRDFDACNLAWTLPTPESDPEQLWHGKNAVQELRSSNHAGLDDELVNELIEAGQIELDPAKRSAIWKQLHARIYELQPYLFGWNVPRKIAVNKRIHGLKLYKFEPGFRMQDLYFAEGTEGTRPLSSAER
ncbi:MAG: peptide/nickel transport system substrate-binding protein [Pseudohongiellaceae bacterium]|jgi:peptide/nickel transport system substrate-binding protein